jgi:multisubunit Na+/H+ antiporter MnhB subunit
MRRTRHPIRGFVAGLFIGLGVAILLLIYEKLTTSSGWPVLAIVGGFALLGVVVGLFGPTRGRRGAGALY